MPKSIIKKYYLYCMGYGKYGDITQKIWSTKDPDRFRLHSKSVITR